jgi:hypothetical protein
MMRVQIGDLLYFRAAGGWAASKIIGEEKRHWILLNNRVLKASMMSTRKVKKGERTQFYTKQEKDDLEWCWRNAPAIAWSVGRCEDFDILKQVATLFGKDGLP